MIKKYDKKRTKTAFNLAEILITLAIIGIIAALTVPTLLKNYQKAQYVAGLKKSYATISSAYAQYRATAPTICNDHRDSDCNNKNKAYYEGFIANLKVKEKCLNYNGYSIYFNETPCSKSKSQIVKPLGYPNGKITLPSVAQTITLTTLWSHHYALVLEDGSTVGLRFTTTSGHVSWSQRPYPYTIMVDINGVQKPNQFGRDIFFFTLKNDTIVPYFQNTDDCNTKDGEGRYCAHKIFSDGWQMKY